VTVGCPILARNCRGGSGGWLAAVTVCESARLARRKHNNVESVSGGAYAAGAAVISARTSCAVSGGAYSDGATVVSIRTSRAVSGGAYAAGAAVVSVRTSRAVSGGAYVAGAADESYQAASGDPHTIISITDDENNPGYALALCAGDVSAIQGGDSIYVSTVGYEGIYRAFADASLEPNKIALGESVSGDPIPFTGNATGGTWTGPLTQHVDNYTTDQTLDTSDWVGVAVLEATGKGGDGSSDTGGGGGAYGKTTLTAPFSNELHVNFDDAATVYDSDFDPLVGAPDGASGSEGGGGGGANLGDITHSGGNGGTNVGGGGGAGTANGDGQAGQDGDGGEFSAGGGQDGDDNDNESGGGYNSDEGNGGADPHGENGLPPGGGGGAGGSGTPGTGGAGQVVVTYYTAA
jgi:hypothetical protein